MGVWNKLYIVGMIIYGLYWIIKMVTCDDEYESFGCGVLGLTAIVWPCGLLSMAIIHILCHIKREKD